LARAASPDAEDAISCWIKVSCWVAPEQFQARWLIAAWPFSYRHGSSRLDLVIHELGAKAPVGVQPIVSEAQHPEVPRPARATQTEGHDVVDRQT
jgi:hypothetical protein